jgi:hypothetical protein
MNATLQVEQLAKLSQADFGRVAEIFQVTFQYSNPQKSIEKNGNLEINMETAYIASWKKLFLLSRIPAIT